MGTQRNRPKGVQLEQKISPKQQIEKSIFFSGLAFGTLCCKEAISEDDEDDSEVVEGNLHHPITVGEQDFREIGGHPKPDVVTTTSTGARDNVRQGRTLAEWHPNLDAFPSSLLGVTFGSPFRRWPSLHSGCWELRRLEFRLKNLSVSCPWRCAVCRASPFVPPLPFSK